MRCVLGSGFRFFRFLFRSFGAVFGKAQLFLQNAELHFRFGKAGLQAVRTGKFLCLCAQGIRFLASLMQSGLRAGKLLAQVHGRNDRRFLYGRAVGVV